MPAILERAVDEYAEKLFWDTVDAAYEKLQADPEAWGEDLQERSAWEATLLDGIEPE